MNRRKAICGCCGQWVERYEEFVDHGEGNECEKCYNYNRLQNHLEWLELHSQVAAALNTLNRFKFTNSPYEQRGLICHGLMQEGCITFKIQPHGQH